MLVKILGAIDVLVGLILILIGSGNNLPKTILFVFGIVLALKSCLGFFKDVASWIDLICAIMLFGSAFISLPGILTIIAGLVIIQKGLVSFI